MVLAVRHALQAPYVPMGLAIFLVKRVLLFVRIAVWIRTPTIVIVELVERLVLKAKYVPGVAVLLFAKQGKPIAMVCVWIQRLTTIIAVDVANVVPPEKFARLSLIHI